MKKHTIIFNPIFLIFVFLLVGSEFNYSQTYIDVAPGFGNLNNAVSTNTDPNAIFRLERGDQAIYLLNGSISNTIPLHIEAANGSGAIPKLIPGVGSSGSSDIAFRLRADLYLKNVYVSGMDVASAMKSQIIRDQADSIKIYADSCFFENSAQSFIRTDNQLAVIHITNSIIRNCLGDYANGRGIDDRGNNMDTLYLENNTFYNISSRVLRDGGGWINYVYVNHNTFANLGKYIMAIGECPKVVFTNNLAIDCGFLGQTKSASGALVTLNSLTSSIYNGVVQSVDAHNNDFAYDTNFTKYYPDTVVVLPNFNTQMQMVMDSSGFDTTNFSEYVTFNTPPPAVDTIISGYWNTGGNDAYPANDLQATGTYDFSYSKNAKIYSGGSDGKPVGALTWFPNITDVNNNLNKVIISNFSLKQNYPNPFNPSTMIEYSIPKETNVRLTVYNLTGQVVKTLNNGVQSAGLHSVIWNGTNNINQKVSSGIYFYKLTTNGFADIKKMILIK